MKTAWLEPIREAIKAATNGGFFSIFFPGLVCETYCFIPASGKVDPLVFWEVFSNRAEPAYPGMFPFLELPWFFCSGLFLLFSFFSAMTSAEEREKAGEVVAAAPAPASSSEFLGL